MKPGENRQAVPRADRFQTTHWELVRAAGDSCDPHFEEALAELCRDYWQPVYVYLRRRGVAVEDAQDLAQGFFSQLLERKALKAASSERGRFRSFMLTSLQYYVSNQRARDQATKRGGRTVPVPLENEFGEMVVAQETGSGASPEKSFERRWAFSLLERTLRHLREEVAARQNGERLLKLIPLLTGDGPELQYRELATELEMTESALKVAVYRLRRRYGELLRDEVARTVPNEDVDAELRYLLASVGE